MQSHRGCTAFFMIPGRLLTDVAALARRERVTLFIVLLAAFKTLLHRYTSQEDIIVGSPLSGRDRNETENLIGLFVNTHALRTDLSGDPPFLDLLKRVRKTAVDAHSHQDVPLDKIVEALQPDRSLSHHALFQVVFGLQSDFTANLNFPGLETSRIELETQTAKFDWTVLATETRDGLRLRFEYNTDLFDAPSIERFVAHFKKLLKEIVTAPHRRLSQFSLVDLLERQRVIVEWNSTSAPYERDSCIHKLFEAQVSSTPDRTALSFAGKAMTYDELNRRANRLARRLQRTGITPGDLVGLCLDRSFNLIISMLAILKAGAAYVPLDRSYPTERLQFMVEDTGIRALITDPTFDLVGGSTTHPPALIRISDVDPLQEDDSNLPSPGNPGSPAYIIYTSGSTGLPKGTIIPHRAVLRLVRNTNYIEFRPTDVFLQLAPVSFDASTFEIWGCLLNGGKLVILPPCVPSLEELGRTIVSEQVSTLWLTAGLFHQMVDAQPGAFKNLRFLLAGGDTLSVPHVLKALRELDHGQLINGYGPTENTTFSCCFRVPPNWSGGLSVPIGRPISNSEAFVLDHHQQPLPIGVPGELYVAGDGLALGYLNRDELTREKFILKTFGTKGPIRLYRTGDQVRWLADGNLQFLGRLDAQLKIRGFRVEPGEVEAVLRQHPAVEDVLVTSIADKSKSKSLVAYVVLANGCSIDPAELRGLVETKVPSFLVPSHFLLLDKFPLTANGKVDRGALPSPSDLSNSPPVPPRNESERRLAAIWSELLGRTQISIHDNFFRLGGHSLLAIQVVSRIARDFGVELPVNAMFENPTVATLVQVIDQSDAAHRSASPIVPRLDPHKAEELLARLDCLSDAELQTLLEDPELKQVLS
jgi:amino acid adenylation domain-containing protein